MTTFTSAKDASGHYWISLEVTEHDGDPEGNTSLADATLRIHAISGWWFAGYPVDASISLNGSVVWSIDNVQNPPVSAPSWSGGSYVIGTIQNVSIAHDADGKKTLSVGAFYDANTHANPRPTSAMSISSSFNLATLTQEPGVPTDVTASRVSDSSTTVGWVSHDPSNGARTANKLQQQINGGSWVDLSEIGPASSLVVGTAGNRKTTYRVNASNTAGVSAYSDPSEPIFTTPAAPSGVSAAKNASLDIVVQFTDNVAFSEHKHVVTPYSSSDGGGSWSAGSPVDAPAGTSSKTFSAPDPAKLWKYEVKAVNTDTGALESSAVTSNTVQLLAAPNKPTLPTLGPCVDKAQDFVVGWTHNAVDTTPQTAYEFGHSEDGGSSWSTTGKTTSTTPSFTIAADTYSADDDLTVRVRTWGQATSGGSDSAGASPWSDPQTVVFKTAPVATITSPVDEGTWVEADLNVVLGFSQAESATFVRATITLSDSSGDLETKLSTVLSGTLLDTQVDNGGSYTLSVTVLDSNGLTSAPVTADFDVAYTLPVLPQATATYLKASGVGQLEITIPTPGDSEAAAEKVRITRTIDGVKETVLDDHTITDSTFTVLDLTPTIHGLNIYRITTISGDGAQATLVLNLTTAEGTFAFFTRGSEIVSFGYNLDFGASPSIDSELIPMAGRKKPIALFGENTFLVVDGTASIFAGQGSTCEELEQFILQPGLICYRDPSGRRMFGVLEASLPSRGPVVSGFQYRVSEGE